MQKDAETQRRRARRDTTQACPNVHLFIQTLAYAPRARGSTHIQTRVWAENAQAFGRHQHTYTHTRRTCVGSLSVPIIICSCRTAVSTISCSSGGTSSTSSNVSASYRSDTLPSTCTHLWAVQNGHTHGSRTHALTVPVLAACTRLPSTSGCKVA